VTGFRFTEFVLPHDLFSHLCFEWSGVQHPVNFLNLPIAHPINRFWDKDSLWEFLTLRWNPEDRLSKEDCKKATSIVSVIGDITVKKGKDEKSVFKSSLEPTVSSPQMRHSAQLALRTTLTPTASTNSRPCNCITVIVA
jgi:hypothetical protein